MMMLVCVFFSSFACYCFFAGGKVECTPTPGHCWTTPKAAAVTTTTMMVQALSVHSVAGHL
jgi:hypothetical protein